jgi:hypothetical protein
MALVNPAHIIFLLSEHYNYDKSNVERERISTTEKEIFENIKLSIDNSDFYEVCDELQFDDKVYCREDDNDMEGILDAVDFDEFSVKKRQRKAILCQNASSSDFTPTNSPAKKKVPLSDEVLEKMSSFYRSKTSGTPKSFSAMKTRFRKDIKSPEDLKKIRRFYFLI